MTCDLQLKPPVPLCKNTCNTFLASTLAVFKNDSVCDDQITPDVSLARDLATRPGDKPGSLPNFCDTLSDSGTCKIALQSEYQMCGFQFTSDYAAFCKLNPKFPCCMAFIKEEPLSPTWIAIIVVSSLVLLLVIGFALFWFKPWKSRHSNDMLPTAYYPAVKPSYAPGNFIITKPKSPNGNITEPPMMNVDKEPQLFSPQPFSTMEADGSFKTESQLFSTRPMTTNLSNGFPSRTNSIGTNSLKSALYALPRFSSDIMEDMSAGSNSDRQSTASSISGKRWKVVQPYDPQMSDEIQLSIGQFILLMEAFPDGWGVGRIVGTNISGVFPLACIDSV